MNNSTTTTYISSEEAIGSMNKPEPLVAAKIAAELKLPPIPPNILMADLFTQIHFAPKGSIPESALDKLYYVKDGDNDIFMKLYDTTRILFWEITEPETLKATGLKLEAWKQQWLTDHPETTLYTPMCIYHFKKHKN